jgi:DNA-binding Lrp family transcriptional regulator
MQPLTGSAAGFRGEHRPRPLPSAAPRAGTHRVIPGYRAIIDPAAVDLGFEIFVQVTMDLKDGSTITEFERGLAATPEIRHAERLCGDPGYPVRVATADPASYQTLRDDKLATLPGVQRLTSTIMMKRIDDDRPYPAPRAAGGTVPTVP